MRREGRGRIARSCAVAPATAVLTLLLPALAAAQGTDSGAWSRSLSGGLALGHVYRFEDTTFGNAPNVVLGAGVRHRNGFGVDVEWNHTFGLTPGPAPCGIIIDGVPAQCVGQGRDGVEAVTVGAVGVRYTFTRTRLRPYLTAGLGVLRSSSVWSTASVQGNRVVLTEQRLLDTGFGPDIGAGVTFAVSPHVSIQPEIRWLDASVHSRVNLGVTRAGARISYDW